MRREKVRNGSPAFSGEEKQSSSLLERLSERENKTATFSASDSRLEDTLHRIISSFLHFNLHKSRRHVPSATRNVLLCCHFSDQGLQERLLVMAANQEYGITTRDLARSPHQTKLKVCQLKSQSWKGLCCPRFGSAWAALIEEDLNGFWHVLMVCVTFFIFSPGHG